MLVEKSYQTFRHPDITPLKKLKDKKFVLELFHGPTFAFKDVALQLLGNLFEFFLLRRNAKKSFGEKQERLTVVGATSGDTGRCAPRKLQRKKRSDYNRSGVIQCGHIWSQEQSQHLNFYPPPKRSRFSYSRSSNDYRHRCKRPQCCC